MNPVLPLPRRLQKWPNAWAKKGKRKAKLKAAAAIADAINGKLPNKRKLHNIVEQILNTKNRFKIVLNVTIFHVGARQLRSRTCESSPGWSNKANESLH